MSAVAVGTVPRILKLNTGERKYLSGRSPADPILKSPCKKVST